MNVESKVARDLGLDDWMWNSREVRLNTDNDRFDERVIVRIAAVAPCRLHIRHESSLPIYLNDPRMVACAAAPEKMVVHTDDESFAQQLLSDRELAERMSITITASTDSVEIDRRVVRVCLGTPRFDGLYPAYMAAWYAASEIVERMNLGVPEEGKLPLEWEARIG